MGSGADAAIPGFEAVCSRYFALKINVPIQAAGSEERGEAGFSTQFVT
jgi:hypothetical protein